MPCLHGKEIVETDGATLSAALNQASRNLSGLCFVISEIKDLVPLMPEGILFLQWRKQLCGPYVGTSRPL
jgi:hypothetical protein